MPPQGEEGSPSLDKDRMVSSMTVGELTDIIGTVVSKQTSVLVSLVEELRQEVRHRDEEASDLRKQLQLLQRFQPIRPQPQPQYQPSDLMRMNSAELRAYVQDTEAQYGVEADLLF
ncbi:hypothetical protein EDC01DRAFT_628930 [Geopyxis carbonaria]|nr:hypothetical protein EDC01DRAFT_628930 [Geopyxis carbonaria]